MKIEYDDTMKFFSSYYEKKKEFPRKNEIAISVMLTFLAFVIGTIFNVTANIMYDFIKNCLFLKYSFFVISILIFFIIIICIWIYIFRPYIKFKDGLDNDEKKFQEIKQELEKIKE